MPKSVSEAMPIYRRASKLGVTGSQQVRQDVCLIAAGTQHVQLHQLGHAAPGDVQLLKQWPLDCKETAGLLQKFRRSRLRAREPLIEPAVRQAQAHAKLG